MNTRKVIGYGLMAVIIALAFTACDTGGGTGSGGGTGPSTGPSTGPGDPNVPYIITGSGSSFTATKSGATVGTANQPITSVINAIGTHTAGQDYTLQFGNGTDVLDIGTEYIRFYNFPENDQQCTITGKITSSGSSTITNGNISIVSTADIANTGTNGRAISNNKTLTINDGTISTTEGGGAISSNSTLTVNGGTISATGGSTVSGINGSGTITINDGTISATGGAAAIAVTVVSNGSTLTINGGTISATGATVSNFAVYDNNSGITLIINGGTISARGTGGTSFARAVSTFGGSTISITDGTILATGGGNNYGISDGMITITGGTISAICTGGTSLAIAVYGGPITITGGTISATGGSQYTQYAVSANSRYNTITISPSAVIIGEVDRG